MLVWIVEIVSFYFLAIVHGPDAAHGAHSHRSAKHVTKKEKYK